MSVLVWDGTTLAVDTASNDGVTNTPTEKIWQFGDYILSGVGSIHDVSAMREWVLTGRKADKFPTVTEQSHFVVVSPSKGLIRYTTKPFAVVHGFSKCAFGTGRDIAYGALYMGASAQDAVRAAIYYGVTCGLDVDFKTLGVEHARVASVPGLRRE